MGRLIDQDDVLMCLTGDITGMDIKSYAKMVAERVKALPTIELRAKGEWITNGYGAVICSKCNWPAPMIMTGCLVNRHLGYDKSDFCWHCGADMRGGQNESD